jgi:hypothetical protein
LASKDPIQPLAQEKHVPALQFKDQVQAVLPPSFPEKRTSESLMHDQLQGIEVQPDEVTEEFLSPEETEQVGQVDVSTTVRTVPEDQISITAPPLQYAVRSDDAPLGAVAVVVEGALPLARDIESQEDTQLPPVTPRAQLEVHDHLRGIRKHRVLIGCLGFLVVIGAVLGGVCGAGHCSDDASNGFKPDSVLLPPPNETQFKSFTDTDELYRAVDSYIRSQIFHRH